MNRDITYIYVLSYLLYTVVITTIIKMAGRGRTQKHGTITVHSPELCDEIFGHSHKDAVRSKVNHVFCLRIDIHVQS